MLRINQLTITFTIALLTLNSTASAAKSTKLSQVFSPDMLNADLAYLEQVTGVARTTYENSKSYKVDGCDVEATINKGSVRSLTLTVSPKCSFNLNTFLPIKSKKIIAANKITFGQFDDLYGSRGEFSADCLSVGTVNCGNAYDPSVTEYWSGSRSEGSLDVILGVVQAGATTLTAVGIWTDAMEKAETSNWFIDAKYNCTRKYDAVAHRAFRNVPIESITIGYNLQSNECR